MSGLPNIDKSYFKVGEYVGYALGVWRIFKQDRVWKAVKQGNVEVGEIGCLKGTTLKELSSKLEFAAKNEIG